DCQLCSTRATSPEQGRVHPGGLPCGARTPEWRARERPSIITHPAVGWVGGGLPPNGGCPAWGTSPRESAHACLPPERGGAPHGVPPAASRRTPACPPNGGCPAWGTSSRESAHACLPPERGGAPHGGPPAAS